MTTSKTPAAYRILILSPIAVVEAKHAFFTLDLWARDLQAQVQFAAVDLLCPITKTGYQGAALDASIKVHSLEAVGAGELSRLVSNADVVQLPGHAGWRASHLARRLLRIARQANKIVIVGISSNRARTAWLNSRNKVIGAIKYLDVRISQIWLAFRSDGVFVVGEGLKKLFARYNSNLFVNTASWINLSDIAVKRGGEPETLTLCMASRMEKMKGMHIGLAAVKLAQMKQLNLRLVVIGDGPEEQNLRHLVSDWNLDSITTFQPTIEYPQPFLKVLGTTDAVLITNLNDEQPRLIFDALSQGCLPICPETEAYRNFGLDSRLFYKQGSSEGLSHAIDTLCDPRLRKKLRTEMTHIAAKFTIDEMHRRRALWIAETINGRIPSSRS
jgi:glycosyltransferase involved in cell wall biosynthesis